MNEKQRQYRTTGLVMFLIGGALLVMRILAYVLANAISNTNLAYWKQEIILDVCFTIPVQVGCLFLLTLLIYKIGLKKKAKEIFTLSGFARPQGKKIALAVLLGFCAYFATIGVSAIWQAILEVVGYTSSSSGMILPEKFNFALFLLSLILTAVLPAFCEEFAMRGVFVKTLDNSFADKTAIIIGGLAFGLFHQYIEQFVYTMLFGMLITYIAMRTGNIWYGVIIHFVNNGLSVFMSYAVQYDFAIGGNFNEIISRVASTNGGVLMVYGFFAVMAVISVILAKAIAKQKKKVDESGNLVLGKLVYKATKRDNICYIGAIVLAALTTVFTFMFGFIA